MLPAARHGHVYIYSSQNVKAGVLTYLGKDLAFLIYSSFRLFSVPEQGHASSGSVNM